MLAEKTGGAVVLALLNFWFKYLGPMKGLRVDLGTEFDNKKVIESAEKYGFQVDPTPVVHIGRGVLLRHMMAL